jgi:hypothetical protein
LLEVPPSGGILTSSPTADGFAFASISLIVSSPLPPHALRYPIMSTPTLSPNLPAFLAHWQSAGGAERSNAQLFITELCNLLQNLVTLNHQRTAEEMNGIIKYLRPEFQKP